MTSRTITVTGRPFGLDVKAETREVVEGDDVNTTFSSSQLLFDAIARDFQMLANRIYNFVLSNHLRAPSTSLRLCDESPLLLQQHNRIAGVPVAGDDVELAVDVQVAQVEVAAGGLRSAGQAGNSAVAPNTMPSKSVDTHFGSVTEPVRLQNAGRGD
jgi:hypothetical protein